MNALFDLRGRLAVVTGASRGIGAAIAAGLAAAGADVIGVSRSVSAGDEVAHAVQSLGRQFEPLVVDFAVREQVIRAGSELARREPDILVNNAGIIERAPAIDHPLESWDRVVEADLSNQFAFTQLVARPMLARGSGKIIFTASLLSFQGGINVPGYAAAKSGIAGLTRALANEWAGSGVNVNSVAPGYIATDNTFALREDPVRATEILARIPARRWGDPADIVGAAVFLASPGSDYVSGVVLPVDGGWLGR